MEKCIGYDVPPSILPACKRIISIGDIHGDWSATIRSFKIAGLIDDRKNWIADPPDTVVIQVGDILDRGRDNMTSDENSEKKILQFFDSMNKKAKKFGGGVYCLMGNHEFMNISGVMDYSSPMGIKGFGGLVNRMREFAPGNKMAIRLGCTRNVLMKVGDFLFVHAGLATNPKNHSIDYINTLMRKYVLGQTDVRDTKDFHHMFDNNKGYLWTRDLGYNHQKPLTCRKLNKELKTFHVGQLVIGHSIQEQGINSVCDNRVWRIDIGMSDAFNIGSKKIQILEILDNGMPLPSNRHKPIRVLS